MTKRTQFDPLFSTKPQNESQIPAWRRRPEARAGRAHEVGAIANGSLLQAPVAQALAYRGELQFAVWR
jgi:hypothetical protein